MRNMIYLLPVVAGMAMITQTGVNSMLKQVVSSPLVASFISFAVGTCFIALLIVLTRQPLPALKSISSAPWYVYLGGMLGVTFVTISLLVAPKIGASNTFALIVAGQLITAVVFDHYGWLGFPIKPISLQKAAGVLLLLAGMWVIIRR